MIKSGVSFGSKIAEKDWKEAIVWAVRISIECENNKLLYNQ